MMKMEGVTSKAGQKGEGQRGRQVTLTAYGEKSQSSDRKEGSRRRKVTPTVEGEMRQAFESNSIGGNNSGRQPKVGDDKSVRRQVRQATR